MIRNKNLSSVWSNLERGILNENPVFSLMIGLCSSLAVSSNVSSALTMGVAALIVLICSNMLVSVLRDFIPNTVRVPAFIIIIAGFTTMVEILIGRFLPLLYDVLGIYLPLIVVNCIILGRAESYASKNSVGKSFLDALGMGLGYILALFSVAFVRELFGNGTVSFKISENIGFILNFTAPVIQDCSNPFVNVVNLFGDPAPMHEFLSQPHLTIFNMGSLIPVPIKILILPPGGFFVMGVYLALIQKFILVQAQKKKDKLIAEAKAKRDRLKVLE